jgi:hypothetical protein
MYVPATSADDLGEHEDKSENAKSQAVRIRSNKKKMSDGHRGLASLLFHPS